MCLTKQPKKELVLEENSKRIRSKSLTFVFMRNFSPEKVADQYDIGATHGWILCNYWSGGLKLLLNAQVVCFQNMENGKNRHKIDEPRFEWKGCFYWHHLNTIRYLTFRRNPPHSPFLNPPFYVDFLKNHATFYHFCFVRNKIVQRNFILVVTRFCAYNRFTLSY